MPDKYYTINEIAELFGVTRPTVYEWMNTGRLEYVVIGARRRVTQRALDAFVESGSQSAREAIEKNEAPELDTAALAA